jgi:lipopolysaccharide export system permease protein
MPEMFFTLLDRYLVRKFIYNLIFSVLAFIIIFLVIDAIENIDKFIDRKAEVNDIIFYYIYYIPYIISLTLPVAMLLACLFAVGNMTQHNEIVAQKSAGVSLYRLFAPLFIVGFFLSIAAGFFNEMVVPWTNQERLDIYRYNIKKNPRNSGTNRSNIYLQDRNDRRIAITFFNGRTNEALKVSLQYFDGPKVIRRIDAAKMRWLGENWLMTDVIERSFSGNEELVIHMAELPVNDLNIKPDNLLELQKKPEEMSYAELNIFIDEMTAIGAEARKWVVELYMKISYPFANFIILLFGAPIAAAKRRSGTALGVGISLLACFIYFLFIRTGQVLGHQGSLTPFLGAWFGNIIFGVAGLYSLLTARK